MSIDINHLNLDELIDLNDRVVERIKQLEDEQALRAMMAFNVGSRVSFDSQNAARWAPWSSSTARPSSWSPKTGNGKSLRICSLQ